MRDSRKERWKRALVTLVLVVITALGVLSLSACDMSRTARVATGGSLTNDASLRALVLSTGTLSPAFAAATTSYSTTVADGTTSLVITPSAASNAAVVLVNGGTVATGASSLPIAIGVGTTIINVSVTSEDGTTTRLYSIAVTRIS
ncbi:MAG: cadherin-like beta sandwich domain-containing protein [bacterium]